MSLPAQTVNALKWDGTATASRIVATVRTKTEIVVRSWRLWKQFRDSSLPSGRNPAGKW